MNFEERRDYLRKWVSRGWTCAAETHLTHVNGENFAPSFCSRLPGHEGPHMTFDAAGDWSMQWEDDDHQRGTDGRWEDWTYDRENDVSRTSLRVPPKEDA